MGAFKSKIVTTSRPDGERDPNLYFWRHGDVQFSNRPHPDLPHHCEEHGTYSDQPCPAHEPEPVADPYVEFLSTKALRLEPSGLTVIPELPDLLFGYQSDSVAWALRLGRAALFFDCGLGKTPMQLAWAAAVERATGRPVLILAPLAVSHQTVREGQKFGIAAKYCRDGSEVEPGVNVTNYERLDKFDASVFGGAVLDESSILKSYSGPTKRALIDAFRATPFKLACTATPAPNDHMELGNHAEFLGVMTSHEMLARWFINDTSLFGNYRLKGHAVTSFWDWVTSWARCAGRPSDLGFSDDGFELPKLELHEHVVDVDVTVDRGATLFRLPDMNATAVHKEKRRTAPARARAVADLLAREPSEQWLVWTDTDYEADALRGVLPEAVDCRGSDSSEKKEAALLGFIDGTHRVLITKPKLAGLGLNMQNCARLAFIGPSFSYEAFYQAVRRSWRFGQKREVHVHTFMAPTERQIWNIVKAKADGHEVLKLEMFAAARRAAQRESRTETYVPNHTTTLPAWLKAS